MRKLALILVGLVVVGAIGGYIAAGFVPGPAITITKPESFAGASIPLELEVGSADTPPATIEAFFEQNGVRTPVFTAKASGHVTGTIGLKSTPGLKIAAGPAKVIVTATTKVWGIREAKTESARDITIRLEKPRVSVVSTKHYINLGGSEMIVYRATPADIVSGVKVGDLEYPGFPASGATVDGVTIADPALHIAFFALRYDQDVNAPIRLFARDAAGETASADFDKMTFTKPFKKSTIPLDDRFLDRVVPAILAGTNEVAPNGTNIEKFVVINSELRKKNNETIRSMAAKTSPELLWKGEVFHPFTNTKAEAAFADFRTYTYNGDEVDKQVHLGFDLASFANTPILAANRGKVLFAAELGIYGNCVVVDHGMGVQSLYGHLSSFAVKEGDMVEKNQELGKSGITGLAGGDHLHFTMLVNGQMVNPIEWWDAHWIADRILRKLKEG
jgi:murein DD-endopeptidase MepM/ murein hydrolase activator NlpD